MQPVLELARREEEAAAEEYNGARQKWHQTVAQLKEMEGFYQDYSEKNIQTKSLRVDQFANSRAFLGNLAGVIKGQKNVVIQAEREMEAHKKNWHGYYLKRQSIDDLITRYRQEEILEMDKREQKLIDEWVSQNRGRNR